MNQEHLGDDRWQCCLVKNIPDGTDCGFVHTTGQSSSDGALTLPEELAENEQVASQAATGANHSKGFVSDAQRDVW